jgi:hypothetical protein
MEKRAHVRIVSFAARKHERQCHLHHCCDIPARFECFAVNWQYDSLSIPKYLFQRKKASLAQHP